MIYIILISIIISHICNKQIYKICDDLEKSKKNTIIIYTLIILTMILIYKKYGITLQSIKYLSLIPFIIVISIIDYHTTYIYDITILSGIISINPKDINKIIIYDINDIATSDKEIVMFESLFNIVNIELETINQGIIGNNLKSNCIIIDDNIFDENQQFIICEDTPF